MKPEEAPPIPPKPLVSASTSTNTTQSESDVKAKEKDDKSEEAANTTRLTVDDESMKSASSPIQFIDESGDVKVGLCSVPFKWRALETDIRRCGLGKCLSL